MKKTKAAVRYGMETLRLSPDELFKLIESSQGYVGDDYPRWLASKIIEVAEADGVLFSQLLVKKFNIINEILEEVTGSQEIRQEYIDIFESCLGKNIYSVDMNSIGNPVEIDWYSGLDIDSENSFFVNEKLPDEIRSKILENEKTSFFIKLSLDSPDKKSDLYTDAKGQGISLQSKGAMMLYRLCSMALSFDISNIKFGIFVPVKFFYDSANQDIIDYTLSVFKVSEGYCMKSVDLSLNNLNSGDIAFLVLETKSIDEDVQDCIELTSIALNSNSLTGYNELATKRYSYSSLPMLDVISEESPSLVEDVISQSLLKPSYDLVNGYKDALGYLNINGSISLSTAPEKGKQNIAITRENIKDIIAYYGVTVSRELEWGYSTDIPCFVNGAVGYEELLYNCLPLFLFDCKVDFVNLKDNNGNLIQENKLDVHSDIVFELLDIGMPYFSFEAKELFNLCKEYIEYSEEHMGIKGLSFKELREVSDSKDFNDMYQSKLANLKDFINSLSKKFLWVS